MDAWQIIDSYFKDHTYPFTKHHIESYRQFLKKYIPNAINTYNPITMIKEGGDKVPLKIEIFVGGPSGENIYLDRPVIVDDEGVPRLLTPQDARLRNLTYQTNIYADVDVQFTVGTNVKKLPTFKRISLGAIPIMLHSDMCVLFNQGMQVAREFGECPYDTGGYFIIDGKEKVIISQERVTTNRLLITTIPHEKDPNFSHRGTIRCTGERGEYALISKSVDILMVRRPDPLWTSMKQYPHLVEYARDDTIESLRPWYNCILVTVAGISGYIPLFTLFRVLGIESDKMIAELILGPLREGIRNNALMSLLDPSIRHAAVDGRVIPRKSTTAAARTGEATPVFDYKEAKKVIRPYLSKQDADSLASDKELARVLMADLFPNIPLAYSDSAAFDNQPMVYLKKAQFLGYIVAEFLKVIVGIQRDSDRDSYIFQRVDVSGILMSELFQTTYNDLRKNCRDELDRQYYYGAYQESNKPEDIINENNIYRFFPESIIGEAFMRAMKGAWGQYTGNEEDRVVQDLNRNSYLGYLSHMRRVKNPLDPSLKVVPPHRLHCQQWGVMCPFETPDGANIGYIKNFALLAHVTFGSSADTVRTILNNIARNEATESFIRLLSVPRDLELSIAPITPVLAASPDYTKIFINGEWYAVSRHPEKLTRLLRLLRRNGYLNPFVNIAWYILNGEVRILTEPGRPTRPLLVLEKGRPLITPEDIAARNWFRLIFGRRADTALGEDAYYAESLFDFRPGQPIEELIAELKAGQAPIEFLDIEEENTCLIAMDQRANITEYHTHLEIDPAMIMSPITQHIPFMQHNMGPRNIFSAGQMKQAIGIYSTRFNERFDPASYIMHYPQKPLVTTRTAQIAGNEYMPNGVNAIVAVATYSGFNQEDSLIINKAAIDRGFFQITAYKSVVATEEYDDYDRPIVVFDNRARLERLGKQVKGGKFANYGLLDDDGFIHKESHIPRGQTAAIIGMVAPVRKTRTTSVLEAPADDADAEIYNDVSMATDIHLYGTVDRVAVVDSRTKARTCKVRFRKVRRPELGDKGVSRYAQKGVIGMILPPEQMPFTKDGVVPDIIINPHSFPSRMCVAQMIECVFAKLCAMEGQVGDGTVFVPFDHEAMADDLQSRHKFDRRGNEVLYNGATGEMMAADIFIGPTFYLRLKHMVLDKINYRGMGANPEAFEPFQRPAEVGMLSPQDQLTRQPTAGRSRGGGLRIGEMERDVLISYGMSHFAKECMMEKADKYKWAICRHCGTLAITGAPTGCQSCGSQDTAKISTPYAFKLWTQEMESVGLTMRLSQEPFRDIIEDESEASEASEDMPAAPATPSSDYEMEGGSDCNKPPLSQEIPSRGLNIDIDNCNNDEEEDSEDPLLNLNSDDMSDDSATDPLLNLNDDDMSGGSSAPDIKTVEISAGAFKLNTSTEEFFGDDDE